ncbi:MAG: OmpA family protein [Ignavibacteriae bacterium]|nr:OmpA family protein [Ignavibacteriota bacterium]
MPTTQIGEPIDEQRAADLRSLRRLLIRPAQEELVDVQSRLNTLHAELHTPEELTALLVPVITNALQKRIRADEEGVIAILAPLVDRLFRERTEQDKAAIVQALAPSAAKALRAQHERFPEEVAEDLAPIMGAAIREQVRLQRDAMVDALYPIIGSTIAKYMAETMRELVENVNRRIEQTLSLRGFMRRIKAKASGVSEAELILHESLPFTVRAAFLIHKPTGILLAHSYESDEAQFDSTLVSGMLTAIRSFVNEWIARSGDPSELHAIEYGRSRILLEAAGHCYVAVVVEGDPTDEFVTQMREEFASIVATWDKEISEFNGDSSLLAPHLVEPLRRLVNYRPAPSSERARARAASSWPLIILLLILIGGPLGWYLYTQARDSDNEQRLSSAIAASLGVATNPVAVEVDGDDVTLKGQVMSTLLLNRVIATVKEQSPESELHSLIAVADAPPHETLVQSEVHRIAAAFNALQGVRVVPQYRASALTVTGWAKDSTLIRSVTRAFERLPGVASLNVNLLAGVPSLDVLFHFERGIEPLGAHAKLLDSVQAFLQAFPETRLRILGHSDLSGSASRNLVITGARAQMIRDALIRRGIDPHRLDVEGTGTFRPNTDPRSKTNRAVRLEVLHH